MNVRIVHTVEVCTVYDRRPHSHHAGQGDIEKHSNSQGEDDGRGRIKTFPQDLPDKEPNVTGAGGEEIVHGRLTESHSGADQNGNVA